MSVLRKTTLAEAGATAPSHTWRDARLRGELAAVEHDRLCSSSSCLPCAVM